jgi:hypothetical protein
MECTPIWVNSTGSISGGSATIRGPLAVAWFWSDQTNFNSDDPIYLKANSDSNILCSFDADCSLEIEEFIDPTGVMEFEARRTAGDECDALIYAVEDYSDDTELESSENDELERRNNEKTYTPGSVAVWVYCIHVGLGNLISTAADNVIGRSVHTDTQCTQIPQN